MRYLFSLLFLLAYGSTVAQQPPMLPRDAAIEAKIEKLLEQMSLDEKIGQMVELEIGMITYRDPRYVVEKLARMSEQELADTLRRFGLDKQHNAAQLALTTPEDKQNKEKLMRLYWVSNDIQSKLPFRLDEAALDSVVGKYKVGFHSQCATNYRPDPCYVESGGKDHSGCVNKTSRYPHRVWSRPDAWHHLLHRWYAFPGCHQHGGHFQPRPCI